MDYQTILVQPGKVARIIFNRPRYLNAQSYLMLEELQEAFTQASTDPQCGAIILSGAGRAFSVGHDIGTEEDAIYREQQGYAVHTSSDLSQRFQDMRKFYVDVTLALRNLSKPTIAMVHGYCIFGGWMLAAAMDVVFAAEDAQFLPGFVEYFSTPWDLTPRRAKEILFEHRFITSREAYQYGFVNRVFPAERLEEETLAYADRVAENYLDDPVRIRHCKLSINHMEEAMGFSSEIEAAFSHFFLMYGMRSLPTAKPGEGGFAKTDVAKKNFELSRAWLKKAGLDA